MAKCMDFVHPAVASQRKLKARIKSMIPKVTDEELDAAFPDDVNVSSVC